MPCTAVAVKEYQRAYDQPLIARAGNPLTVLRHDAEYPGWVWCTNVGGIQAWVPEGWLSQKGDQFVLIKDYNSAELNLRLNERLTLLIEESGWYLAINAGGERGWIPASCLEID